MIRRSRRHQPNPRTAQQTVRSEIIEPISGLNKQRPATNLSPGETPFSQNVVMGDRYIEPRSGLSSWGTTGITGTVLGYVSGPRSNGSEQAYILSSATVQEYDLDVFSGAQWIPLANLAATFSSGTADYFSTAKAIRTNSSSTTGANTVFVTNWAQTPKVWSIGRANINPISSLTEIYSINSYFRYLAPFDERMVWFHSGNTTVSNATDSTAWFPNRVVWSARGNPFDYTNGGFQDIIDMQGVGTGEIAERDRLILLTAQQVWEGRPRRDAFAFDFNAIDRGVGMPADYERTARNTEAGTIWLGDGFQPYRVVANQVRALGDKVRDHLRDEMREHKHTFAIYSPADHIYALFYSDTTGEYPTKALFLRTDTVAPVNDTRDDGAWFMQDFGSLQFTAGGLFGSDIALVTSAGSPYRLRSAQTSDNGTAIDWRWRSHALRADKDLFPFEAIQELWLEYEYDGTQSSTVSAFASTDGGGTFSVVGSSSLTSGVGYTMIPVSTPAARNSMFELRGNDGSRPRLARVQTKLRGYSGRFSGA